MEKHEWAGVIVFAVIIILIFIITLQERTAACTADARICPDGTAVGRVGPRCEFAPCPGQEFLDCAAAGNPVMESYPRQCVLPDGRTVIEAVS